MRSTNERNGDFFAHHKATRRKIHALRLAVPHAGNDYTGFLWQQGFYGSQTSLREANRANLLASIHKFGAMTQVELAEVTGLSTATVSTLVHQLVDEDQLETKSTVRNGRRATLVTLARHQGLGVGLWIARRHLTLSIVDFSKSIIAEHTLPLPLGHKADTTAGTRHAAHQ